MKYRQRIAGYQRLREQPLWKLLASDRAPVLVGLFAVDVGVAYATRSMPQANVFFLALPLKVLVAILLMVASLRYAPALMLRLYQDAFTRVPAMLGG